MKKLSTKWLLMQAVLQILNRFSSFLSVSLSLSFSVCLFVSLLLFSYFCVIVVVVLYFFEINIVLSTTHLWHCCSCCCFITIRNLKQPLRGIINLLIDLKMFVWFVLFVLYVSVCVCLLFHQFSFLL